MTNPFIQRHRRALGTGRSRGPQTRRPGAASAASIKMFQPPLCRHLLECDRHMLKRRKVQRLQGPTSKALEAEALLATTPVHGF